MQYLLYYYDMPEQMTEVFRPTNGELLTRSALGEGYAQPVDAFKKSTSSRPSTQGGYRFGQLSQNSFFTRHNPHPVRVKHLKGLLDVPICAVNDDGYFANPRYSLQFPPNAHDQKILTSRLPVNAINVNSSLHPINTVTGLQYFTGLRNYPFRERAIPRIGLVPVTEAWRDELKALTDAIKEQPQQEQQTKPLERPKTQYSETTGRLIPPPSRAMSRGMSRQGSRQGSRGYNRNFQHIAEDPDMESEVLMILCQILQTEDVNAVKAWLCSAPDREKAMVMDMIRSAVTNKEDYYRRDIQPEYMEDGNITKLPPINETKDGQPKTINRLTVSSDGRDKIETWKQEPEMQGQQSLDQYRPPTGDAFKRPPSRPLTQQNRAPTPKAKPVVDEQPVLRLTTSAHGNRPVQEPVAPATATEDQIGQESVGGM